MDLLTRIDPNLAAGVAKNLGIELTEEQLNRELPKPVCGLEKDPALSLYANPDGNLKGMRVSLLAADGVSRNPWRKSAAPCTRKACTPRFLPRTWEA